MRESDTVARIGGDEFTVILSEIAPQEDLENVAKKFLSHLDAPMFLDGNEVFISASIGITTYPDQANNIDRLMKNADIAMYTVKMTGRKAYEFFSPEIDRHNEWRTGLLGGLHKCIHNRELQLYYQPIIDVASGKVASSEALLRWKHPEKGMAPPNDFIPLAEESGMIESIGEWVLRTAYRQAIAWKQSGMPTIDTAVNISNLQCRSLPRMATSILRESDPKNHALLSLEITESALLEGNSMSLTALQSVSEMGVKLSLDDFGTGFSFLSHLQQLPVNTLKIDQSFVQEITTCCNCATIAKAIIAMADSLKLRVIGEGVETPEQRDYLHSLGCDLMQGYLFAKPMPANEFQRFVQEADDTPQIVQSSSALQ